MVATSQPLAALAGLDILREGGNAIDAAICAAAVLNVIEPMSTGVGGDLFAIFYLSGEGKVLGLNASGRSGGAATLEEYRRKLKDDATIPMYSPLAVTVPGTVDGWLSALARCGSMPLGRILAPAIQAAEEGFPVAPQTALTWQQSEQLLARQSESAKTWLTGRGKAPQTGEMFDNPRLAGVLRAVAEGGRQAFYEGAIAEQIVAQLEAAGGLLTLKDLAGCKSDWVTPISASYRGYEILELPPNGQGIAALEALSILDGCDLGGMGWTSPDVTHLQIEAMKLALHDAREYVTDPACMKVNTGALLSENYIARRRSTISMNQAQKAPTAGSPAGDTVYICAMDAQGNVASLINSIFVPWGSGITVAGTGILMQNRGASFSLDPNHVNVIAPNKWTRHTILPAMIMDRGKPRAAFGCVGGDMQPQGQVQFLCNLIDFGMNVQDAIDAPRWRYEGTGASVGLEVGLLSKNGEDLARRGHQLTGPGGFFGGAQAILVHPEFGTFQGGSDSRRDGCAIGY